MYKILFVSALSGEIKPIKEKIKKLNVPNLKIDFFSTGMGNYNMILYLTKYLSTKNYDFLVNIGTSGYKNLNSTIYQVARIVNGQTNKELIVPLHFKLYDLVTCYSFDKPVTSFDNNNCLVDMEAYGFEMVADSFKLPRLILKIPVDNIGEKFRKDFFLEKIDKVNFKKILESIKLHLKTIPKKENLNDYINYFHFTFSQRYIFEKLYYKYIALKGNNFEDFFKENKSLNKKDFLKKLEQFLDT